MDFWTLMLLPFSEWEILLSSTLIMFIVGMVWYMPNSPTGKIFTQYFPVPKKKPPMKEVMPYLLGQMVLGFIFVHTAILIWMIGTMYGLSALLASILTIKAFMGFVFIRELGAWLWEKKAFSLVLIDVGYYLVGIIITLLLLNYMM